LCENKIDFIFSVYKRTKQSRKGQNSAINSELIVFIKKFDYSKPTILRTQQTTITMSTYQEQLAKCKDTTEDYSNIWKSSIWTISDYEELFEDIDRGYIIQSQEANYFIINPDWEEEEDQYSKVCDEEDCDTILDIDTDIMCYMNNHNGDKTLCRDCYVDGDYKEDDENSDNYDSDDEWCYDNHNECICETGGCAKPTYKCKTVNCNEKTVDLDDKLCHSCYHKSLPSGECYCEKEEIEPCDRCTSKDISWCNSNGCSTEEEIKYIEETYFKPDFLIQQGVWKIYFGGCLQQIKDLN
tara:strand:+ start:76 stop:966 length:891 start_codon:yes stop_codon:yes gene_type:complete